MFGALLPLLFRVTGIPAWGSCDHRREERDPDVVHLVCKLISYIHVIFKELPCTDIAIDVVGVAFENTGLQPELPCQHVNFIGVWRCQNYTMKRWVALANCKSLVK